MRGVGALSAGAVFFFDGASEVHVEAARRAVAGDSREFFLMMA
jgi:hypothetical protein